MEVNHTLMKPPIFQVIPDQEWSHVQNLFQVKRFWAGEKILSQGQEGTQYFYIISTGQVEIFMDDENGYQLHLAFIGPGDYFGEKALLVEEENPTSVMAREDTETYILSKEDFYQFLTNHPELSRHFILTLTQRLHETTRLIEEYKYKNTVTDLFFEEVKHYQDVPFITGTGQMRAILTDIDQAGGNLLPALIEGEYGTGKQSVAWHIHQRGSKRKNAFITLDCRTFSEDNWKELLFGGEPSPLLPLKEYNFGYIELAEGGTLYLKHCDHLSPLIQERIKELIEKKSYKRVGSDQTRKADLRIIASTRENLSTKVKEGLFDPKLYDLLRSNHFKIPPLRERKKAIPQFVDFFIKKYSQTVDKKISGLTEEAMKDLLKHDYNLANIKELEQIIERAVVLPSDDKIWPRHLFLGAPAVKPDNWYYNLLKIDRFHRWVIGKIYPDKLQYLTAIFFALIMSLCFFGPRDPSQNPASFLVWQIWWPSMFLSFFWVGRTWCSVCAYATFGRSIQKRKQFNISLPSFIRKNDALFVTAAFLIILWAEEVTLMRTSPRATGCLMVTMLSMAVICGLIFRRDSWCRYLCPMGGLISVCSMTSVIELRSDTTVCQNQCKKTECYNGTSENPGCPMFQHLLFVDNNQTCKLCLECIRNCPNHSVSLNLRLPGREIWLSNQVRDKMAFFVCALLGSALPVMYLTAQNIHLTSIKSKLIFSLIHFLLPVAMAGLMWLPNLPCSSKTWNQNWPRFWQTAYAYIPLALSAHIAYQLHYLPGQNYLRYLLLLAGHQILQGPMIQPIQAIILFLGLFFSWFCLWEVFKHRQGKTFQATAGFWIGHALLMGCYGAVIFGWLILS